MKTPSRPESLPTETSFPGLPNLKRVELTPLAQIPPEPEPEPDEGEADGADPEGEAETAQPED